MRDATEIIMVLDKSGSMASSTNDVIGGFNTFLTEQQNLPGEANLTVVLFDTTYTVLFANRPIREVPPLDSTVYRAGGRTALNDAVAQAIVETGKKLSDMPEDERPNKVICVIITDGEENASREHSASQVREMVQHQQDKYDWVFIYLGANVDAFAEAGKIGIQADHAVNVSATRMDSAYAGTNRAVQSYRSGGREALFRSDWKGKVR